MNNTPPSSPQEIRNLLQLLLQQTEQWLNTQQPLSLLEKDLFKERLRTLYLQIDVQSTDKVLSTAPTEISSTPSTSLAMNAPSTSQTISEEVANTIKKTERKAEPVILPIENRTPEISAPLYSPTIQEMIENATVINTHVEKEVKTEKRIEEMAQPVEIQKTTNAIEEKTIEARIQEVKAATRFEETRTIGSTYAAGETISEKLHKNKTEKSLIDKIKMQPLADLKLSIGINERFAFINELFHGDQQLYHQSLDQLNSMQDYNDAREMIQGSLLQKLNWDTNNARLKEFDELVKRRFNV